MGGDSDSLVIMQITWYDWISNMDRYQKHFFKKS